MDNQKKEIGKIIENKKKALIKRENTKLFEIQMKKITIEQDILRRKELQLLKQAETYENAEIARNVRAFQKRQLIDK